MSKERRNPPTDRNRRALLGAAVSGAVMIPLAGLLGSRAVLAEEKLSEDDPAAKSLSYVHDATKSDNPKYQQGQLCSNCQLIKSDSGEWRPCQIFPGKLVNANGWCTAWVKG